MVQARLEVGLFCGTAGARVTGKRRFNRSLRTLLLQAPSVTLASKNPGQKSLDHGNWDKAFVGQQIAEEATLREIEQDRAGPVLS